MGAPVSTELEPSETLIRRTTTTDYQGRAAWLPWLVALLLMPLLLAVLGLLWPRPGIERDLTARSAAALAAAGFALASVSFDGRDAVVSGVPAGAEQRALDAVSRVDGVRAARIGTGGAGRTETVDVTLAGNQVVLHGKVPDEATKRAVLDAAEAAAGGRQVVEQLTVQPGSALPGDVARIGDLVGALGDGGGERSISWGSNGVTLSGSAASEPARAAAEAAVRGALGADVPVHNRLMVTADNRLTVSGPRPVDRAAVQGALDALLAGSAILFLPDSAQLTPQGAEAVSRVVEILRGAPGLRVELGGHVAVGPGGPENAMRLSEARAATVRDALVAAGIPADSLTPRGYGDTRPKPDPAASRRVEITVL